MNRKKDSDGLASERKCIELRLRKCDAGFELNEDESGCIDINECLDSNLFDCSQASFKHCDNTDGSYLCSPPRVPILNETKTSSVGHNYLKLLSKRSSLLNT